MISPTAGFSADEIRFLMNDASKWILYVNESIIKAASNGKNQVYIDITKKDEIGHLYWKAPNALIEHFVQRGFVHIYNGQSSAIFEW